MKVVHFQRKPVSVMYFSIENYFNAVRKEMETMDFEVEVAVCSHISQGLLPRLKNVLEARKRQKDINHITGDVHYLNLLFDTRKTILTVHDCVFLKHPSKLARAVLKLFWLTLPARKSAYITCVSEATKKELLTHVAFPAEKVLVIPTVVNEKLFHFSDKPFNKESPSILFIGTTPNKNLELTAQALKGINCTLEIVGKLSETQVEILVENNISYRNEVAISNERMVEKYQECDFLLFPSTYEGFGMPILEAQLTGRSVVTSNCSSMPEVAGNSACLVNPFEVESIRNAVLRIIQDENYRTELIEKGKENVKRYSTKQVAKQYAELYKKVFANC